MHGIDRSLFSVLVLLIDNLLLSDTWVFYVKHKACSAFWQCTFEPKFSSHYLSPSKLQNFGFDQMESVFRREFKCYSNYKICFQWLKTTLEKGKKILVDSIFSFSCNILNRLLPQGC